MVVTRLFSLIWPQNHYHPLFDIQELNELIQDYFADWTTLLAYATLLGFENHLEEFLKLGQKYKNELNHIPNCYDHFHILFGEALLYFSHYVSLDKLLDVLQNKNILSYRWLKQKISKARFMHPDLIKSIALTKHVDQPRHTYPLNGYSEQTIEYESESQLAYYLWAPLKENDSDLGWYDDPNHYLYIPKQHQIMIHNYRWSHVFYHLRKFYTPFLARQLIKQVCNSFKFIHSSTIVLQSGNLWTDAFELFWVARHFEIPLEVCLQHKWVSIKDEPITQCILCKEKESKLPLCTNCKIRTRNPNSRYYPTCCKQCDYLLWKQNYEDRF